MTENSDLWYYEHDGAQQGPVPAREIAKLLAAGGLHPDSLVWRAGMAGWQELRSVPGLAGPTGSRPAPPDLPGGLRRRARVADVPSYLWQSIVVTIACCLITGIPAIVHASKVDRYLLMGDEAAARRASAAARFWCLVSMAGWIALILIYLLVFVVAAWR